MSGLNKVLLIGHLGGNPAMKYLTNGTPCTTFSMATSRRWKDEGGNTKEETTWHNIVAWNKLAETCNQYLHKGSKVYIEGRLQTRSWDGQDGQKHYRTEIVASAMLMLDSAKPKETSGAPAAVDSDEIDF